jgi:hypothetical protein
MRRGRESPSSTTNARRDEVLLRKIRGGADGGIERGESEREAGLAMAASLPKTFRHCFSPGLTTSE